MNKTTVIWLASYPRSGNTFLRTILWQCFGLPSASIYPNDLGGNKELEKYVGHIEHSPDGHIRIPEDKIPLIKTHEYPRDAAPAIYVCRDGRAASVSLWRFYNETVPLETIIEGKHRFGTWAGHLEAWKPWERPDTLLLRYEEMRDDLSRTLEKISAFLKQDILSTQVPERDRIAQADGRWVRRESDPRGQVSGDLLERFNQINGPMMRKMGYYFEQS